MTSGQMQELILISSQKRLFGVMLRVLHRLCTLLRPILKCLGKPSPRSSGGSVSEKTSR